MGMQTRRTPALSAVRRNELSKNKIGLWGAGLVGEKIKCVKGLRLLSIQKVLVNQGRDVCMCVNVISSCLKIKINYSWVTQGDFPEPFLSLPCFTARRQEAADAQMWTVGRMAGEAVLRSFLY